MQELPLAQQLETVLNMCTACCRGMIPQSEADICKCCSWALPFVTYLIFVCPLELKAL